ncbi:MAG: hypothetical protein ACXWMN_07480 [Candidatus Limnocylindria bacterium]
MLLDDLGVLELRLERRDATLQERLFLLGILVFGVLGDVAVELGLVDARSDPRPLLGHQVVQLGLELLEAIGGEIDGLVVHGCLITKNASGLATASGAVLKLAAPSSVARSVLRGLRLTARSERRAIVGRGSWRVKDQPPRMTNRVRPAATAYR